MQEHEYYDLKAISLKDDILTKMWDEESGYFYDLHYVTEEKAYVRNIVGIYPYWAMMTGEEHKRGILPLIDKDAFNTGSAYASVSKDCKVFSPDGGWMGLFFKGRNGCVWCGPSWPYTTGIALEALGNESRRWNHKYDEEFFQAFMEYTIQHFRDGDKNRPYLVEHYNSVSGERLSDEADYNHSFWIDLAVSYIGGVIVTENSIRIEPLKGGLKWFCLDNLTIRGYKVDVHYSKGKERDGLLEGLSVYVDSKLVAHTKEDDAILVTI